DPGPGRVLLVRRVEVLAVRRQPHVRTRGCAVLYARQGGHVPVARPGDVAGRPRFPSNPMTQDRTMDREGLLQREDTARTAFVDAFAPMPDDRREEDGVVPGWSVKDLVWHCGYWADYVGDLLERMAAGQPEPPDQDWGEVNRMVTEDGKRLPWDEVIVAAE